MGKYHAITSKPRLNAWLVWVLVGFANASFCRLFSGDWIAVAAVFVATLVGFRLKQVLGKHHINHYFIFTISAFVASLIASVTMWQQWGNTPDIAIGASVLYLIPGVPLINGIIDIIEGHVLAGTARLINAFLLIICIAFGMAITLLMMGGNYYDRMAIHRFRRRRCHRCSHSGNRFSVISNPPRRVIPCTAILAAIGHSIRFVLLQYAGLDLASASFIAAFSIGLLSHFSAYKLFCPATVLYIPALLPMIPGMYAYRTVFSLIKFLQSSNNDNEAIHYLWRFSKRYNDSLCFIRISCRSNYTYIHFYKRAFTMTRASRRIKK